MRDQNNSFGRVFPSALKNADNGQASSSNSGLVRSATGGVAGQAGTATKAAAKRNRPTSDFEGFGSFSG